MMGLVAIVYCNVTVKKSHDLGIPLFVGVFGKCLHPIEMPKRKHIISSDSEGSDEENLEEVSFFNGIDWCSGDSRWL